MSEVSSVAGDSEVILPVAAEEVAKMGAEDIKNRRSGS